VRRRAVAGGRGAPRRRHRGHPLGCERRRAARGGTRARRRRGRDPRRLAFAGATHARTDAGRLAVVDVGGGSTELAVGTLAGGVEWSASVPVGSSTLADEHLVSDPPATAELAALQADARHLFAGAHPPPADLGLAVGGSATSMARLVPGAVDHETVARAIAIVAAAPSATVASEHGLDPERVRLLPAGLSLLAAVGERLGCPLTVGAGGLREGVCLALTTRE
jgi:exopolyphosphatase/guanosine-5'-triphosphate,3'-diphosphate pyrophosphatase